MKQSAARDRIDACLEFVRAGSELFHTAPGGVRILLDRAEIEEVERKVARRLVEEGLDASGAEVGIVLRDPWFYVLRGKVEFIVTER